jgi:hypothetical protein
MLLATLAPMVVLVASARGEARVPVRLDPASGPVLAAPLLLPALDAKAALGDGWAEVSVGSKVFRFYLGAPLLLVDGAIYPRRSASMRRDACSPDQFVSEVLPRTLAARFRYDAQLARLADAAPAVIAVRAPRRIWPAPNGLRRGPSLRSMRDTGASIQAIRDVFPDRLRKRTSPST